MESAGTTVEPPLPPVPANEGGREGGDETGRKGTPPSLKKDDTAVEQDKEK